MGRLNGCTWLVKILIKKTSVTLVFFWFILYFHIIFLNLIYKYKSLGKKNLKGEIFDFWKDLFVIVIIVVIIRTFLAEPFQISGQSMADSYYNGEFIIVDRLSYLDIPSMKEWKVERWDVVVFKPWVSDTKEYFIKRIVWMPWDDIKIIDWDVFIKTTWSSNFIKLEEEYLNSENNWNTKVWWLKKEFNYVVPEEKYFVMWDNRNHSSDSRTCFEFSCEWTIRDSYISKDDITWKVFLDLWYFDFWTFWFTHSGKWPYPQLKWLDTSPTWFSSPSTYDYDL